MRLRWRKLTNQLFLYCNIVLDPLLSLSYSGSLLADAMVLGFTACLPIIPPIYPECVSYFPAVPQLNLTSCTELTLNDLVFSVVLKGQSAHYIHILDFTQKP
jgi:hypothetical protein